MIAGAGKNRKIKMKSVPELKADPKEYGRILQDMVENAGSLIPDPNWLIAEGASQPADTYDKEKALKIAKSEDAFQDRYSKMMDIMPAWIGSAGRPSAVTLDKYRRFAAYCDPLGLWRANIEDNADGIPLWKADLGTIMDLTLLYVYSSSSERKVTRILEVGGGYGRLAEAAYNIFGHSIKYVLVDAAPVSLYYSKQYLSHACPDARIGSFYDTDGKGFNFDDFDIAIVPSWHFERLNKSRYDCCVNIESMQEMNQGHVDYYLGLFDRVAADGASIYISNTHDYYFLGSWNYPRNWQKLLCERTPRSWRLNHQTEVFKRGESDFSLQNSVLDSIYNYQLWQEAEFPAMNDPDYNIDCTGYYKRMSGLLLSGIALGIARTVRSKVRLRSRLRHLLQSRGDERSSSNVSPL
jgi:hypothetical protein